METLICKVLGNGGPPVPLWGAAYAAYAPSVLTSLKITVCVITDLSLTSFLFSYYFYVIFYDNAIVVRDGLVFY